MKHSAKTSLIAYIALGLLPCVLGLSLTRPPLFAQAPSAIVPPPADVLGFAFVGFEVSSIQTAYARAKAHGAITVSEGGIIDFHQGKAALIRDSDVGGSIMLWQPAK